jgi:uncharacterized membrane protein
MSSSSRGANRLKSRCHDLRSVNVDFYPGARAVAALDFNIFLGIMYAVQTLSFLQPSASTPFGPPFIVWRLIVMATLAVLGVRAVHEFHPESKRWRKLDASV